MTPRWYCVSKDGMATLCHDETDALATAIACDRMYPAQAPHRAVLLGDVLAERERCAKLCEQWNATNPQRLAQAIREGA